MTLLALAIAYAVGLVVGFGLLEAGVIGCVALGRDAARWLLDSG